MVPHHSVDMRVPGYEDSIDTVSDPVLSVGILAKTLIIGAKEDLTPGVLFPAELPLCIGQMDMPCVGGPISLFRRRTPYRRYTVRLMTWGGLRGGISIALALSLPPSTERSIILVVTYCVVVFSILVQGLSVPRLAALVARQKTPSV